MSFTNLILVFLTVTLTTPQEIATSTKPNCELLDSLEGNPDCTSNEPAKQPSDKKLQELMDEVIDFKNRNPTSDE